MDLIKNLGHKALDSRLKRISEIMAKNVKYFYKELGLEIEPNWYLIFKILQKDGTTTVTTIAEQTKYAHPTIVAIVKKMTSLGFLQTQVHSKDKRKQIISLTNKSIELLPHLETIWLCCEKAIFKLLDEDLELITLLNKIEDKLTSKSIRERIKEEYNLQNHN